MTPHPGYPRPLARLAAALVTVIALTGCAQETESVVEAADLEVYATTGYLADAVANIAPEAEVTTMVGPGGDPHTYQPSTQDVQAMQGADVVLWNGLQLEAQMIDQLESLGDRQLAVGELIPEELLLDLPETGGDGEPLHDPHIWNSPEIWSLAVGHVADKLAEADPDNAEVYQDNAETYQDQIAQADTAAQEQLSSIPEESRLLITGHDAFGYYEPSYDLEVHATDFISTEAQLSPGQLSDLADMIVEHEVPVIFQDNQVNPQAITSLQEAVEARGWQVAISDAALYADSLGAEAGVDTYLGVFEHNTTTIAEALGEDTQ